MKPFNFVLFLLLITTSFLMAGFLKIASSPSTGFAVAQIENNKYLVTSQLIPAVRDGNNEISSTVRSFSNNRPADYTCVFNYSTLRYITTNTDEPYQIPLDFSTYDAITRTFTSGMSNYYCRVGNWYREDQGVIVTSEINRIAYSAFCPDSNYCVDSARQCITISGQTTIGANTFTCTNDAQWRQNQIEQPPAPENQTVDLENEVAQPVAPENEATGRVRTQSYVPGEARDRPPARQGECPQEGMCIALDGSCHLVNAARSGVTCAQDGNWKKYVQSYVPGESRLNPPARQGLCDGESQCIALDGSCHDSGELYRGVVCSFNTWKGCSGQEHTKILNGTFPISKDEDNMAQYDVAPNFTYICKDNRFQLLQCVPRQYIMTDVILDMYYQYNENITDSQIRETINKASTYLCSQTSNAQIGFRLRNVIRQNFGGIKANVESNNPDKVQFISKVNELYAATALPQYVIWLGRSSDNPEVGGWSSTINGGESYCNPLPPDKYGHEKSHYFILNGLNIQFNSPNSVHLLDTTKFAPMRYNNGGYYGVYNIVHEYLHGYGGHFLSDSCQAAINTLDYEGRKTTVTGICPTVISKIESAAITCPQSSSRTPLRLIESDFGELELGHTNHSIEVDMSSDQVKQKITHDEIAVNKLPIIPNSIKIQTKTPVVNKGTTKTVSTKITAPKQKVTAVKKVNVDFLPKSSESPSNPVGDFVTWIKNLFGAK